MVIVPGAGVEHDVEMPQQVGADHAVDLHRLHDAVALRCGRAAARPGSPRPR